MITQDLNDQFLDHLHRGGKYAHYMTPDSGEYYIQRRTGEKKQSRWSYWHEADNRKPVPDAWFDKNVYFLVNPVSSIPTKYADGSPVKHRRGVKGRVEDICVINCVFADFDVKDWGDKESIKDHLWSLPLYPSVIIDSVGGYHVYWLLDKTVTVTDQNRNHVQRVQSDWVDLVQSDRACKDLARVLRLPGYRNWKPAYAPEHPTVCFVEADFESPYTFQEIEDATAHLRKDKEVRKTKRSTKTTLAGDLLMASDCLERLSVGRCDDYDDWLQVGMALHTLGEKGLELWEEWSQKSAEYEPGVCKSKWDSFTDDGVTLGSLRHWADADDPVGATKNMGGVDDIAGGFEQMADGQTLTTGTAQQSTTTPPNANVILVAELVKVASEQPAFRQQIAALNGIKGLIAELTSAERREPSIITHLAIIFPQHKDRERFLDECGAPVAINILLNFGTHDEGNAQCTHARYSGKFRYHAAFGWLHHTGTHWVAEGAEAAVERAITATLEARMVAAATAGSSQYGQILKDCLPNNRKVNGAKNQLQSLVDCSDQPFDSDPDLLNCKNGVVNLRTGEVTPHSVDQRFMYCTPVAFNPKADYADWVKWLTDATNAADAVWLRLAAGYSLTGHTTEEILIYLFGKSRSGKGTFDSTMRATLGPTLAKAVQFSTFTTDRGKDDQNFDLAPLQAARFVAASESKQHERFNEAKIKNITGGDSIQCAFKHKTHFEYKPQFKIWLSSNFPVNADPDDDAVWGRIRVIEFPHSHLGKEDKTLKRKMQSASSLEGVLRWAIEGAMAWYQLGSDGLKEVQANADKKQAQRNELDSVQMWIDQDCVVDADLDVKTGRPVFTATSTLYLSYESWCKDNGVSPKQHKGFTQSLAKKGYTSGREYIDGVLPGVIKKQHRGIYSLRFRTAKDKTD